MVGEYLPKKKSGEKKKMDAYRSGDCFSRCLANRADTVPGVIRFWFTYRQHLQAWK